MKGRQRDRVVAGAVLIVIGVGMLGLQLTEGLGQAVWLLGIGGFFLAAYFARRAYGLLIPGGILLGIGLGDVAEQTIESAGDVGSVGLGVGFISIYVIDRLYTGSTPWWPLIPGGILLINGLEEAGEPFSDLASYAWPAALVVVGLVVLFGARRRSETPQDR